MFVCGYVCDYWAADKRKGGDRSGKSGMKESLRKKRDKTRRRKAGVVASAGVRHTNTCREF